MLKPKINWTCVGRTSEAHPARRTDTLTCPVCGSEAPLFAKPLFMASLIGLGIVALIGTALAARTLIQTPCSFKDCILTIGVIHLPAPSPGGTPSSTLSGRPPGATTSPPTAATPDVLPPSSFVPPDYTELESYLEDQLTQQLDRSVNVNVDSSIQIGTPQWIAKANKKLQSKEWDIAFTLSPLVAVDAKNAGYEFAVRMMDRDNLKTVLFARREFPIDYVQDLTDKTRVALADKNDIPGFYLPIYQLYGLEVSLELVPNLPDIVQKVLSDQADVGVGLERMTSRFPNLKVLKDRRVTVLDNARTIPPGGVYLSPSLSDNAKALIKDLLLNAPSEVQKRSMYVPSQDEGDYEEVKKIKARAEEIISCANFTENPVELYCKQK